MSISVTNSKSPITVVDDKVTVKVASGVGPQGAVGPQGPVGPAGAGYTLPAATTTALGGIVVGDNLTVDANGRLSGQQGGVTLLNGQTGVITIASAGGVTAAGGTITIGYVAPPVSSVAGRTGAITLTTADVSGLGSLATKSSLGSITSAGAIGTAAGLILTTDNDGVIRASLVGDGFVIEDDALHWDFPYIKTQLAAVASSGSYVDLTNKPTIPVTSVAGRTGAVTLSTADVSGYAAPPVTSVAGRTGAVTLTTSDVSGYVAPAVTSVAGRTGAVTIAAADVSGLGSLATQSGTFSGTNTGDQTITLTGDVTGSGTGSFAVTIADGAVTLAKTTGIQKVITSGSAAPSGGVSGDYYVQTSAAGQVTPATLTADANDYAPGAGDIYRLSADAARNLTGWTAWSDGTVKLLVNVGVNNITLKHQSASSSASNRFIIQWAGDFVLSPGFSAIIYSDSTDSRIRVL